MSVLSADIPGASESALSLDNLSSDDGSDSDAEVHDALPPLARAGSLTADAVAGNLAYARESAAGRRRRRRAARRDEMALRAKYIGDDVLFEAKEAELVPIGDLTDEELLVTGRIADVLDPIAVLARIAIPSSYVHLSTYIFCIIRACEDVIRANKCDETNAVINLQLILLRIESHRLRYRPAIAGADPLETLPGTRYAELVATDKAADRLFALDRPHQETIYVASCVVTNAIAVLCPSANASELRLALPSSPETDYYELRAASVSDSSLAKWMRDNHACHPSIVREYTVSEIGDDGAPRTSKVLMHTLRTCTVEMLWQSMLMLTRAWPRLRMTSHLVRCLHELMQRAAFFLSYSELVSDGGSEGTGGLDELDRLAEQYWPDSDESSSEESSSEDSRVGEEERRFNASRGELMGLSMSLFGVRDMTQAAQTAELRDANAVVDTQMLVDNADFTRFSGNRRAINVSFIDETERSLFAMLEGVRRCAGFAHADALTDNQRSRCLCCSRRVHDDLVTDEAVRNLEVVISEQLARQGAAFIAEKVHLEVFDDYELPKEVDTFAEMFPSEVHTPQGAITRSRQPTYTAITARFLDKQLQSVWDDDLINDHDEPTHALVASQVLAYHLRQMYGAVFETYYVDCKRLESHPAVVNEAFKHARHSADICTFLRPIRSEIYERSANTGSFRYRNQILRAHGGDADEAFRDYEHPVILRMMNGFALLYRSHLHECGTFLRAFAAWAYVMCFDAHIRGYTCDDKPLHQLCAKIFPHLTDELGDIHARAEADKDNWSAVKRAIPEQIQDILRRDEDSKPYMTF